VNTWNELFKIGYMKQLLKFLGIVIFMMGLCLLIWTIIPEGRVMKILRLDPESLVFSEKMSCEEVQSLFLTEFTVNYPRSIRMGESGLIWVEIEKVNTDEYRTNEYYELDPCRISLEVWIDGEGVVAEPGNKVIRPFLKLPIQEIRIEIFPLDGHLTKGTIWISAVFPGDSISVLERTPIFSVPYAIQVNSLFGLHALGLRILAILFIVLALILINIGKQDRKRK